MATTTFAIGQAVRVFATPFLRADVEHHQAGHAGRPATIVRELLHSVAEYGYREYETSDGEIVHEDRLTLAPAE